MKEIKLNEVLRDSLRDALVYAGFMWFDSITLASKSAEELYNKI